MTSVFDAITAALSQRAQSVHQGKKGTCSVDKCPNNALAKGFCNAHYLRTQKSKCLSLPVRASHALTCIECGDIINNKGGWGLCSKHYKAERFKVIKSAAVVALGGVCEVCNQQYPLSVYDFHHKHSKDHSPSYIISNRSIETIAKELDKCVLLCANCHRIEHNEQ